MRIFISKLTNWLEKVDPYYTQRIILRKGLYLSVWLTIVNWLMTPDNFVAYATSAALLCGTYEAPVYTTFKEKDRYLVSAYLLAALGSVSFYLLFPYKFTLLIYAIAFFLASFFLAQKYFPLFKLSIMQVILVSALNMSVIPEANPQIALDTFFCIMLSLIVVFVALKMHTNLYRQVWLRAFKYYVRSLRNELLNILMKNPPDTSHYGVVHLNTIRAYRHLLPRKNLINIVRATNCMRGLAFTFTHITIDETDYAFWDKFQHKLSEFLSAIERLEKCKSLVFDEPINKSQEYANKSLERVVCNWNKVCIHL